MNQFLWFIVIFLFLLEQVFVLAVAVAFTKAIIKAYNEREENQ